MSPYCHRFVYETSGHISETNDCAEEHEERDWAIQSNRRRNWLENTDHTSV
jgi:hypothetical protein